MTTALLLWLAMDLSAEFWGRTIPLKDDQGNLLAVASDDHIVVEVKATAPRTQHPRLNTIQFKLRLNGSTLIPDTPGMAASAVKYPDWSQRPRLEAQTGPVILGRPQPTPRFPNDPNGRVPPSRTGKPQEPKPDLSIEERMQQAAWADGEISSERTGLLYFPWRGKVAKIKSLEIEWTDGEEHKTVKLR